MNIKSLLISIITLGLLVQTSRADEGMWLPILLNKLNIKDMQAKGFELSAEDIYSINQASLKDAVVLFDGGCTGEIISENGLMLTNYHCAYENIQNHSTLNNNYIENGFWAMQKSEELINSEVTATILKRMEDVSSKALEGITEIMTESDRLKKITSNCQKIKQEAIKNTHYTAHVKSFFGGNQYFLFVNEEFKDVRLVGAPPARIGKFGGDTDNWVWPRHTGDFALYRIYANKNNEPASYSAENIPYKPAKHFEISTKGVKEGDFTMVFGYPGTTEQYVPSYHLSMLKNQLYPKLIEMRTLKLNIIQKWSDADSAISLQYTAKQASLANAWKKWKGELAGFERISAINQKEAYELQFQEWANQSTNQKYKDVLPSYKAIMQDYSEIKTIEGIVNEVVFRNGIELLEAAIIMMPISANWNSNDKQKEKRDSITKEINQVLATFYKNYSKDVDKEKTIALLKYCKTNLPNNYLPDVFTTINKKYKGNINQYVNSLFSTSHLTSNEKMNNLLALPQQKANAKLQDDMAWQLLISFQELRTAVYNKTNEINSELNPIKRNYIAAQMAFEPNKLFYPDANSTLRVAYGNIKGYDAADGIFNKHFTTLNGIFEKSTQNIPDYLVPEKLTTLYNQKDFGKYAVNGTVPVAFCANNHTTGGNSGSPILNNKGQLIGINFDRAWEGVTSDLVFNQKQSRNISVDIRYVLFIIDKYAGASYLIDEMKVEW